MIHYFDNTAQRQQFCAALKVERAKLYRCAGTATKKQFVRTGSDRR